MHIVIAEVVTDLAEVTTALNQFYGKILLIIAQAWRQI